MLQERVRYLAIDDFDKETAEEFLGKYGFNESEKEIAWEYVGGKPIRLIDAIDAKINDKSIEEEINTKLNIRKSEIREILRSVKDFGDEIRIKGKIHPVSHENLLSSFSKFKDKREVNPGEFEGVSRIYLIKKNILFFDPARDIIKTHSKLDIIAIRVILDELKG